MEYSKQLHASKWLAKKYEILKRDNFVCSNCLCDNSENRLEVHHLMYFEGKMAWEYPDYCLVTLCRDCHQHEHDSYNLFKLPETMFWIQLNLELKHNLEIEVADGSKLVDNECKETTKYLIENKSQFK
jgi:hypothetical protein